MTSTAADAHVFQSDIQTNTIPQPVPTVDEMLESCGTFRSLMDGFAAKNYIDGLEAAARAIESDPRYGHPGDGDDFAEGHRRAVQIIRQTILELRKPK